MNTTFKQSHQAELTAQLIEAYMRRGRELRAQAIARGGRRVLAALKCLHTRAVADNSTPRAATCA
jgi:hypothetical protein